MPSGQLKQVRQPSAVDKARAQSLPGRQRGGSRAVTAATQFFVFVGYINRYNINRALDFVIKITFF